MPQNDTIQLKDARVGVSWIGIMQSILRKIGMFIVTVMVLMLYAVAMLCIFAVALPLELLRGLTARIRHPVKPRPTLAMLRRLNAGR